MNENVKKVLMENTWFIATMGEEPNVVPVGFKTVTDDGKLAVGCVLMETTLKNIEANHKIAISASSAEAEAYQIKGTAEFVTEGPIAEFFAKLAEDTFKGAMPSKGALVITPERIIVATPGPDNKKEI